MISAAEQVIVLYERYPKAWATDWRRTAFTEKNWLEQFAARLPGEGSVLDSGAARPSRSLRISSGVGLM